MRTRLVLIAVAIVVLVPLSVFGDPVTGDLDIAGSVVATLTSLDFCSSSSCASATSSTSGAFTVQSSSTGTWAGLNGTSGTILDISNSSTPPGATVSLSDFLTLSNGDTFTLTELDIGTGGTCPPTSGTTCTPTDPALVSSVDPLGKTGTIFENTATGSTAEFSIDALAVVTTPSGQTTDYTGTFSATFDGMTVAQVLGDLSSAGSIQTAFSATFTPVSTTTVVPEPGTASLIAAGLLLLGGAGLRRRFSHC